MLRRTVFVLFLFVAHMHYAQNESSNITKVFNWQSTDTSIVTGYNDCWGFESGSKEYAVIGSNWGSHFLEVTSNLSNPVLIDEFIGRANDVTWRDFKTYSHYMYGVSDGDSNSLQIFDLQYLPDSVVKIYDDNSVSESSHNIFIEGERLYLCSNQINLNKDDQSLDIYSLSNPENPTHLISLQDSFFDNNLLHDIQVVDNIAYCSAGYGGLFIYDLSDLNDIQLINRLDVYPDQGYNHSSWLNDDKTMLVVADEVPSGLALKLFGVSDFENIELLDVFHSHDMATPHNPFFANDHIFVSYYMDGVQVFDYSNTLNVRKVAFYDTYPDNTNYADFGPYSGCWGVYPFFLSKNILGSDRKYGLFVLDMDEDAVTSTTEVLYETNLDVIPNPSIGNGIITIKNDQEFNQLWLYSNTGRLILNKLVQSTSRFEMKLSNVSNGNYLLIVEQVDGTYSKERIIIE